jgi:hypothetical protein
MKLFLALLGLSIAISAGLYYFVDNTNIKAMNFDDDAYRGWR